MIPPSVRRGPLVRLAGSDDLADRHDRSCGDGHAHKACPLPCARIEGAACSGTARHPAGAWAGPSGGDAPADPQGDRAPGGANVEATGALMESRRRGEPRGRGAPRELRAASARRSWRHTIVPNCQSRWRCSRRVLARFEGCAQGDSEEGTCPMSAESKIGPSQHVLLRAVEKGLERWSVRDVPQLGSFATEKAVRTALDGHLAKTREVNRKRMGG